MGRFCFGRRAAVGDGAPEELHVVVLVIADVAGYVEVLAAEVGRGVEEIDEILAA